MDAVKKVDVQDFNMEEQFETIWNHVESGIAIIDTETGEILDMNPAALRLYGGSSEMVIGKQCRNAFCPAEKCPILELNQVIDRSEKKFIKSDGSLIPIIKSVAKMTYKGRPALLESFTDLTPMKAAEEQKRMLEIAEQSNKTKSAFLANMSHEIRTPMNAIIGMTTIGISAPDTYKKNYCLDRIEDASKHLLGIINDILDMSKIEAGKFELSPMEFSFEKMLQLVVNVNNVRINEKEQKLSINIDRAIPKYLFGDEQRLTQVITNLVGNAVKFTPDKGAIGINAQLLDEENDTITIKITVTDTGIGISPKQQERLFQSFQQAESDTTRKFGGTGLGLAISKNIVEMMGGKIWIESELGKGSAFSFTFHVKRVETKQMKFQDWISIDEDQKKKKNEKDKIINLKGRNILLAEDIEINREIVQTLLKPTNLTIDYAENGAEAVRMFTETPNRYDMIFMDVQMPEMDGYEATQRIRSLESKLKSGSRVKGVPIIAMTANVFREDIEKCLEAGMNSHVGKPLNFDEVLDKLKTYCAA